MQNQLEAEYFSKLLTSCFHRFFFQSRLKGREPLAHHQAAKSLEGSLTAFDNMTLPAELGCISDLHLSNSSIFSNRRANPNS